MKPTSKTLLHFFAFLLISPPLILSAQDQDHDADHHAHHSWETGGAVGAVYNFKENHTAPGIHAHILKNMREENRFGMGLGF